MKMNKIAFVVISALCVFTLFSCTDLLTKPLLEQIGLGEVLQYAPDAENLSSADTTTLANAAGDISIAADPVASKAVLEALSAKVANNQNALDDLNKPENKTLRNNILSLTAATILPIDKIVNTAVNAMSGSENQNSMQNVVRDMVKSIQSVDTLATEKILTNAVANNAQNISSEDGKNIMLATISVAISACKSVDGIVDFTTSSGANALGSAMNELMGVFNESTRNNMNTDTVANNILQSLSATNTAPAANSASKRALKTALDVFKALPGKGVAVTSESLMEIFTGGMEQGSN